ncbi:MULTISPECIES: beta-galactosidase [unclassified Microbulbifer]|uniref:beta-galactosidase n=1 Tax=unclassified Microbulbifer TaxID=2619833 RepID=UPI0027E3F46A|nr:MULTISPECIES: beta-galactosidase [unclassified Microbulbifer]
MKCSRRDIFRLGGSAAALGLAAHSGLLSATTAKSMRRSDYKIKKLYHGVAYYPELWPEEDIDRDIVEMKKLDINVARMGEFAWSTMEPERGKISLDFFEMVMDKFHAAGIDVVLCTPTATPPIWLTHNHPERCHKNSDGDILIHGARQHASYEHPDVKEACFKIIKAMAKQLGQHPALIGWQLDNEMKAHVAEDFSDAAIASWRRWLRKRFGTIERLNQAWGTHIWSQYYQSFEQVPAPLKTPFLHNASLSTAYRMFNRESIADFMKDQSGIIREYSSAPITHNDNPAFNIHHERSMEALDFASYDAYPTDEQWGALVFRSDLYRAAIPGRPFWLMETSVSHNGWLGNHQPPHPEGFLAAEAVLTYALGGEAFCYWLWRQQRTGAELPHSAVMSAWFKPSIGYKEVKKLNASRKQLESLLVESTVAPAEVAITYSDHARAMIETEALDRREGFPTRYRGVIEMWHATVRDLGFHRDVRFENAALDNLKLLITPAMPYVSEAFISRVLRFVKAGGVWIAGPVTGIRSVEHTVPTTAGLGLLDELAGINTEFVVPLTNTDSTGSALGITAPLSGWCSAMKVKSGVRSIGTIETGVAKGHAFITERKIGQGRVVILGAQPHGEQGQTLINNLINHYAGLAGVKERYDAAPGVVVSPRINKKGDKFWIAINMSDQEGTLRLPNGVADAVSSKPIRSSGITLQRYQWRAIQLNKTLG